MLQAIYLKFITKLVAVFLVDIDPPGPEIFTYIYTELGFGT